MRGYGQLRGSKLQGFDDGALKAFVGDGSPAQAKLAGLESLDDGQGGISGVDHGCLGGLWEQQRDIAHRTLFVMDGSRMPSGEHRITQDDRAALGGSKFNGKVCRRRGPVDPPVAAWIACDQVGVPAADGGEPLFRNAKGTQASG